MVEDQARKEPVLFFGRRCLRFYELFDPARRSRATIILSPPSTPHHVPSHHVRHPFTTVSYDRNRTNSSFLRLRGYPFPLFLSVPCSFLFVDRALSPSRILSLDHRATTTNESREPIVGVSNFDLRGSGLNHKPRYLTSAILLPPLATATAWKITARRCSPSGSRFFFSLFLSSSPLLGNSITRNSPYCTDISFLRRAT